MLKRLTITLLACLLFSPYVLSGQLEPYSVTADRAFTFALKDLNDKTHTLDDYHGKVVLINFWASWCTPCLLEMPGMQRLANSLNDNSFEILALNTADSPRRIQEVLKRLQVDLLVLQDHDAHTFKNWQGRVLPTSYLFDTNGQLRYKAVGPMEWDDADVILKIKQLIQNQ